MMKRMGKMKKKGMPQLPPELEGLLPRQ